MWANLKDGKKIYLNQICDLQNVAKLKRNVNKYLVRQNAEKNNYCILSKNFLK